VNIYVAIVNNIRNNTENLHMKRSLKMDSVMSCILNRRSIRAYTSKEVSKDAVMQILTAANGLHLVTICNIGGSL